MSSTRNAPSGAPISYEKYMSSPEFAELRGIPATAVAAKAQLYLSARKRSLLFFLQSMSLKDGGMRQLARDLFAEFPERIGSPTMHAIKAKVYDYKTAREIALELEISHWEVWGCSDEALQGDDTYWPSDREPIRPAEFTAKYKKALRSKTNTSVFVEHCRRRREEELSRFLVEVCINPKLPIAFSSDEEWLTEMEAEALAQSEADAWTESHCNYSPWPIAAATRSKEATVPYFAGIVDALAEYQERYAARVASEFVTTTIGKRAIETLDHALATGKMTVVEGLSGSGKSTATKAWCDAHRGEARYVTLSGITHRTSFFQKLAAALGLAACQQASAKLQARIEALLASTKLMVVIDEAHKLWPQHQRSHSNPELVDWVNTALVNQDLPVALICTDQFVKLKNRVEKRTGWTSEQLEHRVRRYVKLPSVPTKEDLEAVVSRLLSRHWNAVQEAWTMASEAPVNRDFVNMIVGYGMTAKMRLPAVASLIDEARLQARTHGRSAIVATDIRDALLQYQIPSDQAMQYAFPDEELKKRGKSVSASVRDSDAAPLQRGCTDVAAVEKQPSTSTHNRIRGSRRPTARHDQKLTSHAH